MATLEALLAYPSASAAVALTDKSGATALHDALRGGKACAANARLLIVKGGKAMAAVADVEGFTSLHLAAAAGMEEEARMLLTAGAELGAADAIGRTVGELAIANGNVAVLAPHTKAITAGSDQNWSAGAREHAALPGLLLAHPSSLLHNAPAGCHADFFHRAALERQFFGQPECARASNAFDCLRLPSIANSAASLSGGTPTGPRPPHCSSPKRPRPHIVRMPPFRSAYVRGAYYSPTAS